QGLAERHTGQEWLRLKPCLVGLWEVPHGGQNWIRCGLTETTPAHARHGSGQRLYCGDVSERATIVEDLFQILFQKRGADPTRSAPAARFLDEEFGELPRDIKDVAAWTENHDRAAGRKVFVGNASPEVFGCYALPGRTTDLHKCCVGCADEIEKLVHCDTKWNLVDSGMRAIAGDAQ